MSSNTFFISDLHLFHESLLRGRKIGIRPFDTLEEMHDTIRDNWCRVVKSGDTVYDLGDVTLERPGTQNVVENLIWQFINTLPGKKYLMRGNHDHWGVNHYRHWGYEDVIAHKEIGGLLLSHYPVHPSCIGFGVKANVHGHTHERLVTKTRYLTHLDGDTWTDAIDEPDPRYVNVSVEAINYTPISLDDVRKRAGL